MKVAQYSDLRGVEICFLLTVEYFNIPYRFSTFPIDLKSTAGDVVQYSGMLGDPNISQRTRITGFDIEAETVSFEVVFPFNVVNDWMKGRKLDDSVCELSMVTLRNNDVLQTYEDRIRLFKGRLIQPIIGDPNQPVGYVAFSVENSQNVKKTFIIDEEDRITNLSFEYQHFESAEGKLAPTVFGTPYNYPRPVTTGLSVGAAECSPGYEVRQKNSGSPSGPFYNDVWILIAAHEVEASSVFIHDFQNNVASVTVASEIDTFGNIVSICNINGTALKHSKILGINTDDIHYWIRWGDYTGVSTAGAHPNPFGTGLLEGGGDLCRWALEKTGLEVDWSSWNGISPLLNRYKFAGYINQKVDALEWLETNIIEHLPIEVTNGPYGLTPIISLYHYSNHIQPIAHVIENGEFEIVSPITSMTEPSDIVNKPIINFAWGGKSDDYKTSLMIDPEKNDVNTASFTDPYSDISYSRFGLHEKEYDLNYVYDVNTAVKILRDKVRLYGLGVNVVEVNAHGKYGYLQLGDVLTLESERLGMTDHVCQIVAKDWKSGRWSFIIHLEENQHINSRN
tara:strand:- start:7556 stop:9250 length:1695 start_codon:yes stop_codon:yes gene_type:complete